MASNLFKAPQHAAVAIVASFLLLAMLPFARIRLEAVEGPSTSQFDATQEAPKGIIVLGGGLVSYLQSEQRGAPADGPGERIAAGIELAKRFPRSALLHTGIEAPPGALSVLLRAGVPASQILIEPNAQNTAENAQLSAALVRPRPTERWTLVTSAHHMPRALACFQTAGFKVDPYPVDHSPSPERARVLVWREYLAMLRYKIMGLCH